VRFELFHAIDDADSAVARRRVAALGLVDAGRITLRNVHFASHAADLAARGGRVLPALWDGARLHEGLPATLAALEGSGR
jgi:hypothetical protein